MASGKKGRHLGRKSGGRRSGGRRLLYSGKMVAIPVAVLDRLLQLQWDLREVMDGAYTIASAFGDSRRAYAAMGEVEDAFSQLEDVATEAEDRGYVKPLPSLDEQVEAEEAAAKAAGLKKGRRRVRGMAGGR